jgi:hypothetical protein
MNLLQTGGCQCGKIRYEITEVPQLVYTCHCTDCQRITGSAFSLGVALPQAALCLTAGEPRALQRMPDSGRLNTRFVCPDCACWVYSLPRGARRHALGALQARLSATAVRVLSRLFRRLFLAALADAHAAGRLAFFGEIKDLGRCEAFTGISHRSRKRIGSSTLSRPSPGQKQCLPISPATPIASPSRTAGSLFSTSAA